VARIASALVLLPVLIGVVGFLPAWGTIALAGLVVLLATREYFPLVERDGRSLPRGLVYTAAVATYLAVAIVPATDLEVALIAAVIAIGAGAVATARPEEDVVRRIAVSLLPLLYLSIPLGAIAAIRGAWGPGAVFALLFTVIVSDTAQYYGGRAFGRRPLAPVVSPKKTIEGALSGLVAGTVVLPALGRAWLPGQPAWQLALVGGTLVVLGITGDLLESLLKRSAGVKDASGLIPGHGGMLDRIDSLLFAGPVFYVFLRFAARQG
jgi:phosphatidate cytidylyltransferase